MDLPRAPEDEDLRNIIEKLAVFVARNGVEFEAMTKAKQRDNPRFSFLFGGEFYNYYMYRVTTEQAILKHKAMRQQQQQQSQDPINPFVQQQPQFGGGGGGGNNMQRMQMNPNLNPFEQAQLQHPTSRPNFDGSPMQQQNFQGRSNPFQDQQGGGGGGGGFDRDRDNRNFRQEDNRSGPGNFQRGNFDQQQQQQQQRMPGGNFDQRMGQQGQGNFEQQQRNNTNNNNNNNMPGNFDMRGGGGPPGTFMGNQQEQQQQRMSSNFDQQRMAGSNNNFDPQQQQQPQRIPGQQQGPGNFDQQRKHGVSRFDQPPSFLQQQQQQQLQQQQIQQVQQQQPFIKTEDVKFDPRSNIVQSIPNVSQIAAALQQQVQQAQQQAQQQQQQQAFIKTEQLSVPIINPPQVVVSQPQPTIPIARVDIEALTVQKKAMEEQIGQSEQNLAAQHQVLLAQQQTQIDEAIRRAQEQEISQLSAELNIDLSEFDRVLEPIIESCTKDAISSGKAWIFTHTSTPRHYHLVTSFLLRKTMDPSASFNQRLHVIYLVNDVLHHCMRKGAADLQKALEDMVIPMFCYSKVSEASNEENTAKLDKLFTLWETKSNYVTPEAVEKLRNFNQTLVDYKNDLMSRHAVLVATIANNIQQTYDGYKNQHQIFCQHVAQGVKTLDQQIQQAIIQQQIQIQLQQQQQQQQVQQSQQGILNPIQVVPGGPVAVRGPIPGLIGPPGSLGSLPPNVMSAPNFPGQLQGQGPIPSTAIAPPYIPPGKDLEIPDLSRPPPGFPTPPPEKDLIPALPYYELPAGLMVTLVKLEDDNYKAIDPKAIRLPPPCPPSERLIQAVDAFYAPASHERPRDSEGWERLGLYEYYKAKNLARKQKEDEITEGKRTKSRSPSPIRGRDSSPNGPSRSPPRRRYQSKSPTPVNNRSRRRDRDRESRSRSRSPPSSRRSSKRSSRRSRSRSPVRRSPSPPSFATAGLGMDNKLDESNKGHQLLKKMGWGGTGLGANEQGIEAPISGGEVRERKDLYRGVGVPMNDPFESYRKSKGQAFVERMRSRGSKPGE